MITGSITLEIELEDLHDTLFAAIYHCLRLQKVHGYVKCVKVVANPTAMYSITTCQGSSERVTAITPAELFNQLHQKPVF